MIDSPSIADMMARFELVIFHGPAGWAYQWEDSNGRIVCCGTAPDGHRASKGAARAAAKAHLRRALKGSR